jgi:hypothetical protein
VTHKVVITDTDDKLYVAKINIVDEKGNSTYGVYVTEVLDNRQIKE